MEEEEEEGKEEERRRGEGVLGVYDAKGKFLPSDLIVSSGLPLQCTAHSCRQPKDLHLIKPLTRGVWLGQHLQQHTS